MTKNIKYPFLPKGRSIRYVSINNIFMQSAKKVALERSTDQMQPTGAVIVKNNKIVSKGANQSKLKNKKLRKVHQNGFCMRKFLKIPSGKSYWLCPGCSTYKQHAEKRAVANAKGKDISDSDLYLWGHWWCCKSCWNAMIDAEINNVYLLENSQKLFNKSNPNNKIGKYK